MSRFSRRGWAAATLLALALSWIAAWSVALHMTDAHHAGVAPVGDRDAGLDLALHGHPHAAGTPAHEHPVAAGAAARLPGRLFVGTPAFIGNTSELEGVPPAHGRIVTLLGSTHDPPWRLPAVSVLRI